MPDEHGPYYLEDPEVFTDLESQISIIPPILRDQYQGLERKVSQEFLNAYGQYLTDKQIQYIQNIQTLFTDPETAQRFSQTWEIELDASDDATINGDIYMSYSFEPDPTSKQQDAQSPFDFPIQHFFAGRIAVYPLGENEIYPIQPELLIPDKEYLFDPQFDNLPSSDTVFRYTRMIAANVIHEKVHGLQDHRLPLPIMEAAAYYYQRELFKSKNWSWPLKDNMSFFADLYGQCIEELGDGVHRLVFGNIHDDAARDRLLLALKERFSSEKIQKLSQQKNFRFPFFIRWEKCPAEEIRHRVKKILSGTLDTNDHQSDKNDKLKKSLQKP